MYGYDLLTRLESETLFTWWLQYRFIRSNLFSLSLLYTIGVPKDRRGEIWRFLLKQDALRHKRETTPSMTLSYRELKEMRSVHQHAILIDCSKFRFACL